MYFRRLVLLALGLNLILVHLRQRPYHQTYEVVR